MLGALKERVFRANLWLVAHGLAGYARERLRQS